MHLVVIFFERIIILVIFVKFRNVEILNFQLLSIIRNQNVIRFQIPMDNPLHMQIFDPRQKFSEQSLGSDFTIMVDFMYKLKHFHSFQIFHNKKDSGMVRVNIQLKHLNDILMFLVFHKSKFLFNLKNHFIISGFDLLDSDNFSSSSSSGSENGCASTFTQFFLFFK